VTLAARRAARRRRPDRAVTAQLDQQQQQQQQSKRHSRSGLNFHEHIRHFVSRCALTTPLVHVCPSLLLFWAPLYSASLLLLPSCFHCTIWAVHNHGLFTVHNAIHYANTQGGTCVYEHKIECAQCKYSLLSNLDEVEERAGLRPLPSDSKQGPKHRQPRAKQSRSISIFNNHVINKDRRMVEASR
jgi:hypothetical protein